MPHVLHIFPPAVAKQSADWTVRDQDMERADDDEQISDTCQVSLLCHLNGVFNRQREEV